MRLFLISLFQGSYATYRWIHSCSIYLLIGGTSFKYNSHRTSYNSDAYPHPCMTANRPAFTIDTISASAIFLPSLLLSSICYQRIGIGHKIIHISRSLEYIFNNFRCCLPILWIRQIRVLMFHMLLHLSPTPLLFIKIKSRPAPGSANQNIWYGTGFTRGLNRRSLYGSTVEAFSQTTDTAACCVTRCVRSIPLCPEAFCLLSLFFIDLVQWWKGDEGCMENKKWGQVWAG